MPSPKTTPEQYKTVIEVRKMVVKNKCISYIAIELIKYTEILTLVLQKHYGKNFFWMLAEKPTRRGSTSKIINDFPEEFKDEDYTNREIIGWICDNADYLINRFRKRR